MRVPYGTYRTHYVRRLGKLVTKLENLFIVYKFSKSSTNNDQMVTRTKYGFHIKATCSSVAGLRETLSKESTGATEVDGLTCKDNHAGTV